MSKFHRSMVLLPVTMLVVSCATPYGNQPVPPTPMVLPEAKIVRHPLPADISGHYLELTEIPKFNPDDPWQVDLRSRDLTKIDMTASLADLHFALFDSKTQWPSKDKIPSEFDPQEIMETGKDPGLGIRVLHAQGITGKGVNIAIVDQPLIVEHVEYANQIRLYEEINISPDTESQMHGPAVVSIAVGRTVGVAPEANLYYMAAWLFDPADSAKSLDYRYKAQALRRIVEINQELTEDQKIRAVSMSIGLHPDATGYKEFISAIEAAKEAGIFAITVSLDQTYGRDILGLGRDPGSDPNNFQSYEPASWWKQGFFEHGIPTETLLIPMESRTTASQTGAEDYVFFGTAGMSWTVPYLAGMYALAVQVKPEITPEEFLAAAMNTGKTIQIEHDGKDYQFGIILDPQALIGEIIGR